MSEIFIAKWFIKLSRGLYLIKINFVFFIYCYGINNIEQQYFSCSYLFKYYLSKRLTSILQQKNLKKSSWYCFKFCTKNVLLIKVIILVFLMSLNICAFSSFLINGVPQYTWFVLILFTPFRSLLASNPLNASNILPLKVLKCGQVVCHMSLI